MKQTDILILAKKIAEQYGYTLPKITFNKRLKFTTGKCYKFLNWIELNLDFCLNNNEEIISGLIKHELAHMKYFDHGDQWKKEVIRMDTIPLFCTAKMNRMINDGVWTCDINYPYQYVCPNGHISRKKMPIKEKSSCGSCSKYYDEKYLLKLI